MALLDKPQPPSRNSGPFQPLRGPVCLHRHRHRPVRRFPGVLSTTEPTELEKRQNGFWTFIQSNLPFYLLHSFISLFVCFVLLLYMDDGMGQMRWRTASTISLLAAGVALASLFYAAAQVQHQFNVPFGPNGADLAVLMIVINVSAALMAFASAALCKRQAETSPDGPQPLMRQDPPRTHARGTTGIPVNASLAPAAPAGE